MIHLFIDTNRYLTFYWFPKEELEEIRKLIKSIKDCKIKLWVPQQTVNEFHKNREKILLEKCGMIEKTISDYNIPKLPVFLGFEKELEAINELFKSIKKTKTETDSNIRKLIESIKKNIREETLLADSVIKELFSSAKILPHDDEIMNKARTRFDLGIPPGKGSSYGDAVIWETLLKGFPEKEILHFVSSDKDFRSNLDENSLSPFLIKEWKNKKKSEIVPYKILGRFTKKQIPEIESEKIIREEREIDKHYFTPFSKIIEALGESITKRDHMLGSMVEDMKSSGMIGHIIEDMASQNKKFEYLYGPTLKVSEMLKSQSAYPNYLTINRAADKPIKKDKKDEDGQS